MTSQWRVAIWSAINFYDPEPILKYYVNLGSEDQYCVNNEDGLPEESNKYIPSSPSITIRRLFSGQCCCSCTCICSSCKCRCHGMHAAPVISSRGLGWLKHEITLLLKLAFPIVRFKLFNKPLSLGSVLAVFKARQKKKKNSSSGPPASALGCWALF